MSYPQGYLYQPPGSLALYPCPAYGASALAAPRNEDLARSSSGSAFSPYPGSAAFSASAGAGFSSPLSYSTDPATGFPSYMSSPYDTTGMAGALSYHHPYGGPGYPYQLNDPAYRKNATRDATTTLKAWLQEHRKNPYPTKGEKIMLAIITKMTLTQVSTWFANARRRLKKENKMTWAPRNKSEDEDEEDGDTGGDTAKQQHDNNKTLLDNSEASAEDEGISLHVDTLTDHSCSAAESDGEKVSCRPGDRDHEDRDELEERVQLQRAPKAVTSSPLSAMEAPVLGHHQHHLHHHHLQHNLYQLHHLHSTKREDLARSLVNNTISTNNNNKCLDSRSSSYFNSSPGPPQNPVKPKLWSLAEIATSDQKHPTHLPHSQHEVGHVVPPVHPGGILTSPNSTTTSTSPPSSSSSSLYQAPSSILARPIYYTSSPFYGNYANYGNFGPGQSILRYTNSSGVSLAQAAAAAAANAAVVAAVNAAANDGLNSSEAPSAHPKHRPDSPPLVKTTSHNNLNNIVVVDQQQQQHFRAVNLEAKKGT